MDDTVTAQLQSQSHKKVTKPPWSFGFDDPMQHKHKHIPKREEPACILYSVIVLRGNCVIHRGQKPCFKGMTTATSGVLARFPLLLPVRNSFASYGASAVTRTSDRGHVAEARNQGHRSGGVSIRVSKETLLPLNVHLCSVSSTKMLNTVH